MKYTIIGFRPVAGVACCSFYESKSDVAAIKEAFADNKGTDWLFVASFAGLHEPAVMVNYNVTQESILQSRANMKRVPAKSEYYSIMGYWKNSQMPYVGVYRAPSGVDAIALAIYKDIGSVKDFQLVAALKGNLLPTIISENLPASFAYNN